MALWEFRNLNKHGNYRKRIIHTEGALNIPGSGFGPSVMVNRFKYKYEHPIMPPMIWKNNGKTYLMPLWQEVVKGTTVDDIEWIKPKPKIVIKQEPIVVTSTSSSSDKTYTTTYYPDSGKFWCDCPGMWRSGGNCKHVKKMRKDFEK